MTPCRPRCCVTRPSRPATAGVATRPGWCSTRTAWTPPRCRRSRPTSATPRPPSSSRATTSRTSTTSATSRRAQEVPFCGHATIASGVALVERHPAEELVFHTPAGLVTVNTARTNRGLVAELTSVSPRVRPAPAGLVAAVLDALGWRAGDLDPDYPVRLANAGSEHLVLVTRTRERLADLRLRLRRAGRDHAGARADHGAARLAREPARSSTPATRSPAAASSRTPRPARPPPRSAATSATSTRSAPTPSSRSARASTWAGRARSRSA